MLTKIAWSNSGNIRKLQNFSFHFFAIEYLLNSHWAQQSFVQLYLLPITFLMVLTYQTLSIFLNSFLTLQDELVLHSSEIKFICLELPLL